MLCSSVAEAQSTVTGTEHSAQLPGREAQADPQAHGRDSRQRAKLPGRDREAQPQAQSTMRTSML